MKSQLDRWVIGVAAVIVVLLIGQQSYRIWRAKTTAAVDIKAAEKLVEEAEKNTPPPPLKDPKEQSERVLDAWETLPSPVKPLTQWNLYPNPAANPGVNPAPRLGPGRRGGRGP